MIKPGVKICELFSCLPFKKFLFFFGLSPPASRRQFFPKDELLQLAIAPFVITLSFALEVICFSRSISQGLANGFTHWPTRYQVCDAVSPWWDTATSCVSRNPVKLQEPSPHIFERCCCSRRKIHHLRYSHRAAADTGLCQQLLLGLKDRYHTVQQRISSVSA